MHNDVLSVETSCPLGHLVRWDVLSVGTSGPLGHPVRWDIWHVGASGPQGHIWSVGTSGPLGVWSVETSGPLGHPVRWGIWSVGTSGSLGHPPHWGIRSIGTSGPLGHLLDHELLINLRGVEIYGRPARVEERNMSVPLNLASFSKLKSLLVLKLEVNAVKISTESEEDVIFFPSLESLTLDGTTLKEDPMPALQKLPRLQDLVLKECEWSGAKMSIGEQGFGRLRKPCPVC
ncbi:hypothetical protein F2Q69_00044254 [Brassica cretica]|uniref:Uncharacterized protein n=1 Tax=Brassica cretica TaxID=69181 RepID=A0A8S9NFC7_BRACR|nr:hypothetical protein F2Q69_00044254 [Brassica cretica]